LKVSAEQPPSHGKCPDCGRIVPVPAQGMTGAASPESRTADLSPADLDALERWSRSHLAREATPEQPLPGGRRPVPSTSIERSEVGLRVCPKCGKPVHLGANACRSCGAPVGGR
jgi:hypothetical protein